MSEIDLTRTAGDPISEGVHPFEIISHEEGEGDKGTYWVFTCKCLTPSEASRTARLFISHSPQARWRVELFLDAVKAPKEGKATAEKFLGRKFRAKVTHEIYEGRPQTRLNDLFPMTAANPTPTKKPAGVAVEVELPKDVSGGEEEIPF